MAAVSGSSTVPASVRASDSSFLCGERLSSVPCNASWKPRAAGAALPPVVCKESRIGKRPIEVPKSVSVTLDGQLVAVSGPLGQLSLTFPREVKVEKDESNFLNVARALDTRKARQMHGLFRTLTDNMVIGVSKGFEKKLQLIGVGYRAAVDKTELTMNLGFSHQVRLTIPEGITVKVEENTRISISGRDKCAVGDFSAAIRKWRPPEPYKGKGIKYSDEVIRRKEGKVGKKK